MFGSYSVINIIVLLNMLIAMMSNSYQIISERADIEWKFARSQLWISYFDDGGTVPPPFNLCPSVKLLQKINRKPKRTRSVIRKSKEKALALHDKVMRLLVRRYVTAEQKNRDDFTITEDDIIEVRADISTLRFELLDIFSKNNMEVPDIDKKQKAGTKKGKVMERRILKDFQIGIVEGIKTELSETSTTDVFGTIAKVIGKKQSLKGREPSSKKEWNAIVRKNTMSSNPIGSTQASMVRRSQRSLRRKMVENANEKLNTEKLLEYNPKLGDVTATTRVAYVKFMAKTLDKRGFDFKLENEKDPKAPSDSDTTKSAGNKVKSALTASAKKKEQDAKEAAAGPSGAAKKKDDAPPPPASAAQKSQSPEAPGKPEAKDKTESASKPAAPAPAADNSKGKAPSAPGPAPAPAEPKKDDTAKPPPPNVPAKTAAGDSKSTDQKDQKADEKKEEKKDEKKDEKKPDEKKPDEKKPDGAKPDEKKPDGAKPDEKKPDDKKPGDKKDTKKPPAKPAPKQEDLGQSSAAAGGDRGKSTVTGRMISGWL